MDSDLALAVLGELWPDGGDLVLVVDEVVIDQPGHGDRGQGLGRAEHDLQGIGYKRHEVR